MSFIHFIGVAICFLLSSVNCLRSNEFDHFVYTQQWPQGVCECIDAWSSNEKCKIPASVKTWTVHGLWPTLGNSEKPQYCNNSWPFEESKIVDIEDKMKIFWPKLIFPSNSRISFWEHEWVKHGTCCTSLPILNSEHKYFSVGLDLNQKYNLLSILNDAGIVPSKTESYELSGIRSTLEKHLGVKPYMHCCKSDSKQRIQEVMICLDKQLKLIDCTEEDEDCTNDVPVYYEPIKPSIIL